MNIYTRSDCSYFIPINVYRNDSISSKLQLDVKGKRILETFVETGFRKKESESKEKFELRS